MKLIIILLSLTTLSFALDLKVEYFNIKTEAIHIAKENSDFDQRIEKLREIYLDSNKRYPFALIAAHGAKWAKRYFQKSEFKSKIIRLSLIGMPILKHKFEYEIEGFIKRFQNINRQVFIDIYTQYYFSKKFGLEKNANQFIAPALLKALNKMHFSVDYSMKEKENLFLLSLKQEQNKTVAPGISQAIDVFSFKFLLPLILAPKVKFSYFPSGVKFKFNDFSKEEQRIYYANLAYQIAQKQGWYWVERTL